MPELPEVETVVRELRPHLNLDCVTVTGRTLGEEIDLAPAGFAQDVVAGNEAPLFAEGGMAVLRGNLAPRGAIIKQSAATPDLMVHRGRAVAMAAAGAGRAGFELDR